MGTSTYTARRPRRRKMVSIVVAGAVPLALMLGGTAIANAGATSATVTRLDYSLPEPPPPHEPSPDEPLLEQQHPQPTPESTQPEPPPDQTKPDLLAR
ncbi:hypothetical protein ACIHDR_20280 [Nocardia sp. NPDC052278]|uniref:hypothetical protein n=1 Tax=unclassified Nocardia TaxID=2637762 RepID=UPI0036D02662